MNKPLSQARSYMLNIGLPICVTPTPVIERSVIQTITDFNNKTERELEQSLFPGRDTETYSVDKPLALSSLANQLHGVFVASHSLGLAYLLPLAFEILVTSNSTILWTSEEIDRLQHDRYHVQQVVPVITPDPTQRLYRVTDYRGKVIKSPSYEPPDFSSIFDTLSGQELLDFTHAHRLMFNTVEEDPDIPSCIIEDDDDSDSDPY